MTSFSEKQYILPLVMRIVLWFGLIAFIVLLGLGFIDNEISQDRYAFMILASTLTLVAILLSIPLKTKVDAKGITLHYPPLLWNRIYAWDAIERIEVCEVSILSFGGWGYRYSLMDKTWGLIFSNKGGIKIRTKKGKTLVLSTRKLDELQPALKENNIKTDQL
jgi:hypothetical protein